MVNGQRGDVEDNIHHVGVQDHEVEREGEGHSQQQPGVALKNKFYYTMFKVLKSSISYVGSLKILRDITYLTSGKSHKNK